MVEKSELIRDDIERTRIEMGQTLDALGYKANVPARTKGWLAQKKSAVVGTGGSIVATLSGATDSMVTKVSGLAPSTPSAEDIQSSAGTVKDIAERNPLGLTLAGAALGFVGGLFAPSTRIEDERIGPVADQLKSTAAEAGQEALDHGKEMAQEVAQAAAQTAVETARTTGKEHGDELAESLNDKAREVAPAS